MHNKFIFKKICLMRNIKLTDRLQEADAEDTSVII